MAGLLLAPGACPLLVGIASAFLCCLPHVQDNRQRSGDRHQGGAAKRWSDLVEECKAAKAEKEAAVAELAVARMEANAAIIEKNKLEEIVRFVRGERDNYQNAFWQASGQGYLVPASSAASD